MKKIYSISVIDIIKFESNDIITTSNNGHMNVNSGSAGDSEDSGDFGKLFG